MDNNKIAYLQMIQEPIGRMSTNSAIFKGFAAAIVAGVSALTYKDVNVWVLGLSFLPVLVFAICFHFRSENIDHIHIRTAESEFSVAGWRQCSAITKNINVGKRDVHSHWAELSPLGIVIEGISDFVPTVTSMWSNSIH